MAEQLISTAEHDTLPDGYDVRPETQRPRLREVVPDEEISVIDPDRAAVVARVAEACRTDGFFQVLNHGVSDEELSAAMMSVAYDFFRLPAEEKAKLYSDEPGKKMRLSTSFNVRKKTVHNWQDYLRLHCHPLEQYVPVWPHNPPSFRAACARMWKKKNIICSGSALPRWSGGSGPSCCLLPVVGVPSLGRRASAASSSPGHSSSQRRFSAAPESTIIPDSEIPLGDIGENAAPDATATASGEPVIAGTRRSCSPPPEPPAAPPASATSTAATNVHEDAMKVLLVIIGANITILMNIKDINSTWKTEWKVLYGIFVTLSLVSTVGSVLTALSPADSWRAFSALCARFGLLVATALFVVFLACQLGHFGCVAGVPTAALIVLLLGVVWWNCSVTAAARPTIDIGTASNSEEWIRDHEAMPL